MQNKHTYSEAEPWAEIVSVDRTDAGLNIIDGDLMKDC